MNSKNGTCSFKSEVTQLKNNRSFPESNSNQFWGDAWKRITNIFGTTTYWCDDGNYYWDREVTTNDSSNYVHYCVYSDFCSKNSEQDTCVSKKDGENYLCIKKIYLLKKKL